MFCNDRVTVVAFVQYTGIVDLDLMVPSASPQLLSTSPIPYSKGLSSPTRPEVEKKICNIFLS